MTLRRLHVPHLPADGGSVTLDETVSHHVRVLRLREGDEVELFDGRGRTTSARIESVGAVVVCHARAAEESGARTTRVVLMLALPKGSTLDDCVRMATELGVDRIALLQAQRSVPKWDSARAQSRIDRLTRIAVEAATQCERADIPIISAPRTTDEWLGEIPHEASRVVFGARATTPLVLGETPEQVWCAIGPEGGFSDAELAFFVARGFTVASLGRWILRVDTAVAAALTLVQDRLRSR